MISSVYRVYKRKLATLASIQDNSDLPEVGGGDEDKSCLTTYLFNPVETCAGVQTPEKRPSQAADAVGTRKRTENAHAHEKAHAPSNNAHMHPNFLFGKVSADGRPNFLRDYELSYRNCEWAEPDHAKCCVAGHFGRDLSFGHLYTISKTDPLHLQPRHLEERTYDEPYAGGGCEPSGRRSWLCCPGSRRAAVEGEQPPLLEAVTTTTTTSTCRTPDAEAVTRPPGDEDVTKDAGRFASVFELREMAIIPGLVWFEETYVVPLCNRSSGISKITVYIFPEQTAIRCITTVVVNIDNGTEHANLDANHEKLQLQLDEQAQRYEEQLTELHSVIAELTRKLHQQRAMAIAEEDEVSESCTSVHEESITCPLEVSELEPLDNELSDVENKMPLTNTTSPFSELLEPLKTEITHLKHQLHEANSKLARIASTADEETPESPESHIEADCEPLHEEKNGVKYGNIVPVHRTNVRTFGLILMSVGFNSNDLANSDVSTAVAEHIVGDILKQCDVQAEKQCLDIELKKVNTKLEHARSQNTVLVLTLAETKAHCDRLALGVSDRTIEAYDVLLALLETAPALEEDEKEEEEDAGRSGDRSAAEAVARRLLRHLDSSQSADVLLSPWQNHGLGSPADDGPIPSNNTNYLVNFETLKTKMELMGLREDKAELISKLFVSEKEKSAIELKFKYAEGQLKAQSAALKNLQGQLKDTEALLVLATQNKERGYSDAEHAQGVEFELMQALAREARLKVRLQELVTTLEHVTKNAEARLLEGRDIVQDLNHTNRFNTFSKG
ncbi:unnamed protein product [Phaedon cochleariae]|uniref:Uncharacterized protein n=1 Tax=Phaedon cochleariae TaxID=80249 RepID=A0A9P0DNX7_PHACE|nr:unnamed protein product [Phaedon cochleariae]